MGLREALATLPDEVRCNEVSKSQQNVNYHNQYITFIDGFESGGAPNEEILPLLFLLVSESFIDAGCK